MKDMDKKGVAVYCRVAREEQKTQGNSNKTLDWKAYYHDANRSEIRAVNVFDHCGFYNNVAKYAKEIKDKEEFAEKLRRELMYYFWSKFEYEVIIGPWGISRETREIKVDVYGQIMLNWEHFLDYVWENRRLLKGNK